MEKVSKAIAGAVAGGVGAPGAMLVTIPEGIIVPWWGYVIAGVVNAAFAFGVVYFAPANKAV